MEMAATSQREIMMKLKRFGALATRGSIHGGSVQVSTDRIRAKIAGCVALSWTITENARPFRWQSSSSRDKTISCRHTVGSQYGHREDDGIACRVLPQEANSSIAEELVRKFVLQHGQQFELSSLQVDNSSSNEQTQQEQRQRQQQQTIFQDAATASVITVVRHSSIRQLLAVVSVCVVQRCRVIVLVLFPRATSQREEKGWRVREVSSAHISARQQSRCVEKKVSAGERGEKPGNTRARMIDNAAESEAGIGDRAC